jgi:hypothetical protein
MAQRFSQDLLDALKGAREIDIETSRDDRSRAHPATVWVVVDDEGRVLVRSWRGASARWFREALRNPRVTLVVGGRRVPAAVVVANDEKRIQAASGGYRSKYAKSSSMPSMLADEILSTTLELVPRRGQGSAQG